MVKRKIIKNTDTESSDLDINLTEESNEDFIIEVVNPHDIRLPPSDKGKNEKEKDGLFLVPGQNSVSKDYWLDVKKKVPIKKFLRYELLKDLGQGKAKPILETLDGVSLNEGKDLIKEEIDIKQLNKWKDNTENSYLKRACEAKIKQCQ